MSVKQSDGNFYGVFFRLCRGVVRIIFPKYTVQLPKDLKGPVAYISHHQNLHSPFFIMLWFTKCVHTWMLHVFLDQKACYAQYVEYTFTKRFSWNRLFAKACALPLSYGITVLLNSGQGIPVYRGSRKVVQTFKQSVEVLTLGESILICPDMDYSDTSSETKEMYDGFLSLDKYYFKKVGKHVLFVPMYVSKSQKKIIADHPICFRNGVDFKEEKRLVYSKIQAALNQLAESCGDL